MGKLEGRIALILRAAHCLEGNVKVVMLSAQTCSITR